MSRSAILFLVMTTLGLAILLALLGWTTIPSNSLGWFLLLTGLIYFLGVMIVYWVRRIQFWGSGTGGETAREEQGDRSFWRIVLGMISTFYLPPLEYLYANSLLPRGVWIEILGWLLIVLGSLLFVWARRVLGEFYSAHVSVVVGQPLVQSGPYQLIRHPAYAGYLLIALGVAVGYSSLAGLAAFLFLLSTVTYRIRVEDRLLADYFGPEFARYAQRTKRLIPGIW